ncbi:MAG: hypothetical protein ACLTS6_17880 [Anaerobutyricum sp.]
MPDLAFNVSMRPSGNDENLIRISFEDGGMLAARAKDREEVSSSVLYVL